ncbi:MAG TPA: UbiA prenyltransferase family protein [Dehalococcoidales bacterium]|nr:UbiA prenyltransferase family protein [Dehalococcoidales bacterium]
MSSLMQRWMGQGHIIKDDYSSSEKAAGFIDITRPVLSIMGALGVGAAAALAFGGFPAWHQCLVGFIAALLAFAGIHAFNDFADSRRDVVCWPGRPIPSRRLSSKQALFLAILTFALSLVIVWVVFNPVCFVVSLIAIVMGCLYSAYLRDRVGYLVLPLIEGSLWLCGWTAFSPETLFTSWVPWSLYAFSALWQAGHIMIYSPLHPIRQVKGKNLTQVPAFFVTTSPRAATIIGVVFLVLTIALGIFLGFYLNLGLIFLIPVAIMGFFSLVVSISFMNDSGNFGKGIKAFTVVTYFMTVARLTILLSVLFTLVF